MKKTQIVILVAIVIVVIGVVLAWPSDDGGSGKPSSKEKKKTHKLNDKVTPPPEEQRKLHVLLPSLEAWGSNVKPTLKDRTMDKEYVGYDVGSYISLNDPEPFDKLFTLGSMIYLLDGYLRKWDKYDVTDKKDIEMLRRIRNFSSQLSMETDLVSVTVHNSSSRQIKYGVDVIPPGKSITVSRLERHLGKPSIGEGSFGIDGQYFPYNPDLAPVKYDAARYTWEITGPSTYKLTIRN